MTKNVELPVVSKSVGALSRESLETLAAIEASLTNQDTTEADRLNAKNAVEEYIYDIRHVVLHFVTQEGHLKFGGIFLRVVAGFFFFWTKFQQLKTAKTEA